MASGAQMSNFYSYIRSNFVITTQLYRCRLFIDEVQHAKRSCMSCNKFKKDVLYRYLRVYNLSDGSATTKNIKHMGKEEVSLKVKELRRENLALKAQIKRQAEKLQVIINYSITRLHFVLLVQFYPSGKRSRIEGIVGEV